MENIDLKNHLINLSNCDFIPNDHKIFLIKLKESGFEPTVIYDIGACVTHWTKFAKQLWPRAKFILFDAFAPAEFLYKDHEYNIGLLSNEDNRIVKFYQNDLCPTGNSYYREIGLENGKYYPEDKYVELISKKLDTIVMERGFPLPDLVKIDVQGAEIDLILGGLNTLNYAKRMIVELQKVDYNDGAPKADKSLPFIESLGWKCDAPLFQDNGPDGDYSFVKI